MKVYGDAVDAEYRIKAVVERSGFSAATLRYYETIGLLPPAPRTSAGYRVYDDRTVERLAFIARAKQLGCSLEEIADLAGAWDGGRCGPVQDRLRSLVAEKLTDTERQIGALITLTADLRRAAASLDQHRPDGPCDAKCGCITEPTRQGPPRKTSDPKGQSLPEPPIACTLRADEMPRRLEEWQAALVHVTESSDGDRGLRLTFDRGVDIGELARLVASEQDCCRFLRFTITLDERGTGLEIDAPSDARSLVHAIAVAAPTRRTIVPTPDRGTTNRDTTNRDTN